MKTMHVWVQVQNDTDRETHRMPVTGGAIYLIREKGDYGDGTLGIVAVFVPAPAPKEK